MMTIIVILALAIGLPFLFGWVKAQKEGKIEIVEVTPPVKKTPAKKKTVAKKAPAKVTVKKATAKKTTKKSK